MEWNSEMEGKFMQVWHDLMKESQGTTRSNAEKLAIVTDDGSRSVRES